MVGDYSSADVIPAGPNKGNAISVFAVGVPDTTLNQGMYVVPNGLPIVPGTQKTQAATPAAPGAAQPSTAEGQPDYFGTLR